MSRRMSRQVAVVGAGPAGLSAAIELADAGGDVVVLDEGPSPGGQVFRQPPASFSVRENPALATPNHRKGHHLLLAARERGIEVRHGVTVYGAAPDKLEIELDGRGVECEFERLILATGAHDRAVAFPGWTLPGVITAGAAQVMVRGYAVAPGQRALVAGTGPLLLPTITALIAAGVEVVGALEACGRGRALGALPAVLWNGARRKEAWHYARVLLGARTRLSMGWAVFEAKGEGCVQSAVIGRVDRTGRPRRGTAREVDVDLICTGFGLSPSIELARLLGCEMHHVPVRGGWLPVHDEDMLTSVSTVHVAGEIAGIGGADVAMVEGRLAGLAIADGLGLAGDRAAAIRRARADRQRERRASDAMLAAFPVLPGLHQLADDATIVCRCEDVTLDRLRDGVEIHGRDLRGAKMGTRAGMGPCQGRVCQPLIADLLTHRLDGPAGPPPCPSVQVPVKPVSVETMLGP